jgi:hypothetical protein
MRSITITLSLHQSQCTSGSVSCSESAKLRRSCEQLVELRHYFARFQAPAVGPELFQQAGGHLQQGDVMLDDGFDAGAQDLDGDLAAVGQFGEMHLRHRGRGDRGAVEAGEDLVHRFTVGRFKLGDGEFRGEGRHAILKSRQFVGNIQRQKVAARGQDLAELDENRPQCLQRLAQAHGAWRRSVAPEHQGLGCCQQAGAETLLQFVFEDQAVEAVAVGNSGNAKEAEDAHGQ